MFLDCCISMCLCIDMSIYISRNSVKVMLFFRTIFITSRVCHLKGKIILLMKYILLVKDSVVGDLKETVHFSASKTEDHILRQQTPTFYCFLRFLQQFSCLSFFSFFFTDSLEYRQNCLTVLRIHRRSIRRDRIIVSDRYIIVLTLQITY